MPGPRRSGCRPPWATPMMRGWSHLARGLDAGLRRGDPRQMLLPQVSLIGTVICSDPGSASITVTASTRRASRRVPHRADGPVRISGRVAPGQRFQELSGAAPRAHLRANAPSAPNSKPAPDLAEPLPGPHQPAGGRRGRRRRPRPMGPKPSRWWWSFRSSPTSSSASGVNTDHRGGHRFPEHRAPTSRRTWYLPAC